MSASSSSDSDRSCACVLMICSARVIITSVSSDVPLLWLNMTCNSGKQKENAGADRAQTSKPKKQHDENNWNTSVFAFLHCVCVMLTGFALSLRYSVCVQQRDGTLGRRVQIFLSPRGVQIALRLQKSQGQLTHKNRWINRENKLETTSWHAECLNESVNWTHTQRVQFFRHQTDAGLQKDVFDTRSGQRRLQEGQENLHNFWKMNPDQRRTTSQRRF